MRTAIMTVLFACALVFVHNVPAVNAAPQVLENEKSETIVVGLIVQLNNKDTDKKIAELLQEDSVTESQPVEPVAKVHTVAENETLISIAKLYDVEWTRIFDKNITLVNPNIINVGEQFVIPEVDEQIEKRPIPEPPVVRVASTVQNGTVSAAVAAPRGSASGNLYTAGNCTWYVKSRRSDIPNNLGNASTWVTRASAQGMATGSAPQAGAVGQRGNHVVYVESVNSDGTITISEMNHKGLYVQTVRTLPADYFTYIY